MKTHVESAGMHRGVKESGRVGSAEKCAALCEGTTGGPACSSSVWLSSVCRHTAVSLTMGSPVLFPGSHLCLALMSDSFSVEALHQTLFMDSRGLSWGERKSEPSLHHSAGCRAPGCCWPSSAHLLGTSTPWMIKNINIIFKIKNWLPRSKVQKKRKEKKIWW